MIAYLGDPKIKSRALAQMRRHREADHLVRGQYWVRGYDGTFRGCAVGCLIHSGNHAEYETRFGIPEALAKLEDAMFEDQSLERAMEWPCRFLGAIETGSDLSMVASRFTLRVLRDGLVFDRNKYSQVAVAVDACIALYERRISGDEPTDAEWDAARSAVESAARAAQSVARSAAESAAWSVVESAARAVESAAWDRMADWLIEELEAAPMAGVRL